MSRWLEHRGVQRLAIALWIVAVAVGLLADSPTLFAVVVLAGCIVATAVQMARRQWLAASGFAVLCTQVVLSTLTLDLHAPLAHKWVSATQLPACGYFLITAVIAPWAAEKRQSRS